MNFYPSYSHLPLDNSPQTVEKNSISKFQVPLNSNQLLYALSAYRANCRPFIRADIITVTESTLAIFLSKLSYR